MLFLFTVPLWLGIPIWLLYQFGAAANDKRLVRGVTNALATRRKCPDCAEMVQGEAKVCRYCGCKLEPTIRSEAADPLGYILDQPSRKRAARGSILGWAPAVLIIVVCIFIVAAVNQ
jgi:hypothetical protein